MAAINLDNKFIKLALFAGPSLLARYPHYDYIHFTLIVLYFLMNPEGTILNNPVFWTSYLSAIGATFDEFYKSKMTCSMSSNLNQESLQCVLTSSNFLISAVLNIITICIGYIRGRGKPVSNEEKK